MSGNIRAVGPGAGVARVASRRRIRPGAEIGATPRIEPIDGSQAEDLRLIVEEAADPAGVVYTVVNRRTGEIVSRHTSEDIQRMSQDEDYTPGEVIDTTA